MSTYISFFDIKSIKIEKNFKHKKNKVFSLNLVLESEAVNNNKIPIRHTISLFSDNLDTFKELQTEEE